MNHRKKHWQTILSSLILSLSLFSIARAQLSGKIVDAGNQSPLPGASIRYDGGRVAISDQDGLFELEKIHPPDTLRISYVGYEPAELILLDLEGPLVIEMQVSNYLLGEVRVTAFESRQNILETPASLSMISKKELKQDNDVYMVPALNRVPGIFMHSGTYNTSRLTIRGIGSRSLFATSKIRAYYGDIPLTTGDGETTIEDIDPNLVERIEIIKGPSSSLYGAGLGGTLLIRPKTPSSQERQLRYQITGGSFGYLKNALSLDYGTRKHRLNLSINDIHSNGWRENNEFDRLSAGLTYTNYLSQKTSFDLITNLIDLKAFIPSSLNRTTFESNPEAAAPNWKGAEGFEDYIKTLAGMGVRHHINDRSEVYAGLFWSYRDAYERRPFNNLHENTHVVGGRGTYHYRRSWKAWKLDLMAGVEYLKDFYDWQTYEIVDLEDGDLLTDNQETRENSNIFIKTDITLPTRTFLTLGLNMNHTRYDYDDLYSVDNEDNSGNYGFGTTWSPRLGITQPLFKKVNAYLNISHGFSPPTLAETLTPEGDINPDIRPESGMNYEIGTKGLVFRNRLYFDLALFSMDIRNLIVARRIGDDQFVGVNAGETLHRGMELSLNYDLLSDESGNRDLIAFLTYTLADYTFEEFVDDDQDYSGNALTGIPGNVFNAGFSFRTAPGIYGNLNYQFVDAMPVRDDNQIYTDPYQLVNGKVGYARSLGDHFQADLYFILQNIFDEHYASMVMVNASSFGGAEPRYYYPGMPRNFYAGLEVGYRF